MGALQVVGEGKPLWYTVKSPLWMEPKSGVWAQTWSVAQQYFDLALVSFIFSFSATTIWISLITFTPSVTHSLLSLNSLTSDLRENRAFQHSPSPCLDTHSQTKKYSFSTLPPASENEESSSLYFSSYPFLISQKTDPSLILLSSAFPLLNPLRL